jgi:hypothetical protein
MSSPSECNIYELTDVTNTATPLFFENAINEPNFGELDSAGEDCTTGIAISPAEFSSDVYIADLTQASKMAGSPGTWNAPSQVQTLSEVNLVSAGASGIAVAQGTHIGIVTDEFGGNSVVAMKLPATSGSGTPAISEWVQCSLGSFVIGDDPHPVTAYQSPNSSDAMAIVVNEGATSLAVVDLTKMLNPTLVPRTTGGHACAAGTLPASVESFVAVP